MSRGEEIWLKGMLRRGSLGEVTTGHRRIQHATWRLVAASDSRAAQRRAYAATLSKSSMILRRLALIS
jgi:hypothetical protein